MIIDIDNISKDYTKKKILVIGDIILDAYEFGRVDRISQEAPVPIVSIDRKSHKPGGAANVALNLSGLGATIELIGIAGNDNNHDELKKCFKRNDNINLHLVKDKNRPTSIKTRIIADGKQIARLDEEHTNDINLEIEQEIKNIFDLKFANVDGIIIEDYNKGTLTKDVISHVTRVAAKKNIPVYVDPKHNNYDSFKGVRLFKPNLIEFNTILKDKKFGELPDSGFSFKNYIDCEILLLTLGADGMSLYHKNNLDQIPTKARKVYDVSGAGDTVIATFAINDICGVEPLHSSYIANLAAGRVCEEIGVFPITMDALKEMFDYHDKK